ncbi:MAG: hypothetical protein KQI35_07715 [Bacteroidetes bacterium]|nr:hypothetical protein [Bacteroidota bacterium]
MEKQSKAPMIYGYAVCLVTVITFIICVAGLVNAVIDLGDPLHAERDFSKSPSLASFENYKMDLLTSSEKELSFVPDDETLRAMYESAKDDKLQGVKHRALRDIMVNGLLIVICIILFWTHWRWMRKLSRVNN